MDSDQRMRAGRRELHLQGPRPTPLKISKESHKIRKAGVQLPHRSQPVIIYTQSPKIIHIEAQNFMTLVQRLTGSSSILNDPPDRSLTYKNKDATPPDMSKDNISTSSSDIHRSSGCDINEKQVMVNKSDSAVTNDTLKSQLPAFSPLSPNFLLPSPQLLSPSIFQDLPLFTPNFDSFFYSPGHFYRLSEPIFTPPQRTPPSSIMSPSPTAKTHPHC